MADDFPAQRGPIDLIPGDPNTGGGTIISGATTVFVNNRQIALLGSPVTGHLNHAPTNVAVASDVVRAENIKVTYEGAADVCGHVRAGGSSNVLVGLTASGVSVPVPPPPISPIPPDTPIPPPDTPPDPPPPDTPPIAEYGKVLYMPMSFPAQGGGNNRQYTADNGHLHTDDLLVVQFDAPAMANLLEIDCTADGGGNIPFDWAVSEVLGDFTTAVAGGTAGMVNYKFATNPDSQYVRNADKENPGTYFFNVRFAAGGANELADLVVIFIRPNV